MGEQLDYSFQHYGDFGWSFLFLVPLLLHFEKSILLFISVTSIQPTLQPLFLISSRI